LPIRNALRQFSLLATVEATGAAGGEAELDGSACRRFSPVDGQSVTLSLSFMSRGTPRA
jgi:hypothetical protein